MVVVSVGAPPPPPPPPPLVVDVSPESVGCTGSEGIDPIGPCPWLCGGAGVFAGLVVPLVVQCCKLDLQHGLVEGLVAPFTVGREGLCGGC